MASYVALLRGINVGGRNRLPMENLRREFHRLGCKNVRSYIQSGNVVFSFTNGAEKLSAKVAAAIETRHGFRPAVIILKSKVFSTIVATNPFADSGVDPTHLHVWILSEPAANPNMKRLQDLCAENEKFSITDLAFYLYAPDGVGRSRLASNAENCLGVPATSRNRRTLDKLAELIGTFLI